MNIGDYLPPNYSICNLAASHIHQAIVEMLNVLIIEKKIPLSSFNELNKNFNFREGLGMSYNNNIAYLCVRCDILPDVVSAVGYSLLGITYDSSKIVHTLILLMGPSNKGFELIDALIKMGPLFNSPQSEPTPSHPDPGKQDGYGQ
jgi:hypothetical protein